MRNLRCPSPVVQAQPPLVDHLLEQRRSQSTRVSKPRHLAWFLWLESALKPGPFVVVVLEQRHHLVACAQLDLDQGVEQRPSTLSPMITASADDHSFN